MSYNQSKWLYDILQDHGFDVCVDAFKQNISVLERKDDLDKFVKYHLKRLSIITVNRQDYLQDEIRKCEKTMRDSIDQAHDDMFCTVYNVVDIVYNYVAAEAVRAKLLAENEACCGRELQNAQHSRYLYIAGMLKDANNDNVVDDIVEYVRSEVENYGELIGGKGFIDYVLKHLHEGTELSIWASGSKWLDEKRVGNVFERLALLRREQFEASKDEKTRAIEERKNTKPQQKRKSARSKETDFTDCILHHDTDKVMNALSELLREKGGTEAAAIIFVLVENGIIARPTTDLLISTFEVNFAHRNNFNTPYSAFENVKNNAFTNVQKKNINKAKKQISNFLCI